MYNPKIALIHDWLFTWFGGSERVTAKMLQVFPGADVFTLFEGIPEAQRDFLRDAKVQTSFLQKLPNVKRYYRHLLPLMPLAVESFDLSGYDLVISSSHAVAKGVITAPGQMHISYCHSPIRYAWDLQHQYLSEAGLNKGIRKLLALSMLHYIRLWDLRTTPGVDHFVSNSRFVSNRIRKVYGRESTVIYPPVDVHQFSLGLERDSSYMTVARLVPYKRVSLLIRAFAQMPNRKLTIIGEGPLMKSLCQSAPPNIEFAGHQSFSSMQRYLQRAKAFVYAAEEDFGISMVEAQACGTPVIAYGSGGALETVIHGKTGIHFKEQTPGSIIAAVEEFERRESTFKPEAIRAHAMRFSSEVFGSALKRFVLERCRNQDANARLQTWAQRELTSSRTEVQQAA